MKSRRRSSAGSRDVERSDAEWRQALSPEAYAVLRGRRTERPFSGRWAHPGASGVFRCAGCGAELFLAEHQFDSGTGWPSFRRPAGAAAVEEHRDWSMLMPRTEVLCRGCGGHLGHVFGDGPDGGPRYCINDCALDLDERPATGPAL